MAKAKKTILRKRRLNPLQATILRNLATRVRSKVPSDHLKILAKKGLVKGNIDEGWVLTSFGIDWLCTEDSLENKGRVW